MTATATAENPPRGVADIRIAMMRNGYSPIPCNGKQPAMREWEKHIETNETEILLWDKVYPYNENTGFLTRNTPVLDVDVTDTGACGAVFKRIRDLFGGNGKLLCRIGNSPKFAIPFCAGKPFKKMKETLTSPDGVEMKLELLCDGQQCIAFGRHPSGVDYRWWPDIPITDPTSVPRADLPHINEERARELLDDLADLLVRDFGYARVKAAKNGPHGNGTGGFGHGQHELVANIIAGRELHDSIVSLAAKFVISGMGGGAAVNQLRALIDQSAARTARPGDWQERHDDIPRIVRDAQEKFGQPKGGDIGQGPEGIRENPGPGAGAEREEWPEPDLGVLRMHHRPPTGPPARNLRRPMGAMDRGCRARCGLPTGLRRRPASSCRQRRNRTCQMGVGRWGLEGAPAPLVRFRRR
jgi:hypothetical protein